MARGDGRPGVGTESARPAEDMRQHAGGLSGGSPNSGWAVAIGAALVLGAIAVRLWGLGWGLPYVYHADEPVNLTSTLTMLQERDPNPHFFNYPPFYYYVEAGGQLVYYGLGVATGNFASIDDIALPETQTLANGRLGNPKSLLAGRLVSVAFSVGTVALVYVSVLAVSGSLVGAALAGFLMAFTPLAVRRGRLLAPDPMATFFTAAALAASFLILRRGRTVDYVIGGVLVGLAGASKYHVALVALAVLAAHVMRTGRGFLRDGRIYLAGGLAVATFLITSPYVLLDFPAFWDEFAWKSDFYSGGSVGGGGGSYAFYARALGAEYGILLVLVPFAFAIRRFRREAVLAAGFAVLYVAFISFFVVRFDRHLLPVLPAVAITIGLGAAGSIILLRSTLAGRKGFRVVVSLLAVGVVVALGIVFPLLETAEDGLRYSSDERAEVREWIHTSLPESSTVLVDAYSPFVDPERFRVTAVAFAATGGGDPTQYEYVVVAEQGSGRFLSDPDAHPDQVAAYEQRFGSFCEIAFFPGPWWHKVLSRDCVTK